MGTAKPQRILAWEPESKEALQYFCSIPWCHRLLLSDSALRPFKVDYMNRTVHGWDPVVSGLLARPDAAGIRCFLSTLTEAGNFAQLDHPKSAAKGYGKTPEETSPNHLRLTPASKPTPQQTNPFPQHVNFYAIGADLAGVPNTAHGGVIALLVDSICGQIGLVHSGPRGQFYSAYTNVRFLRPLIIPPSMQKTIAQKQRNHPRQNQEHDHNRRSSPLSSAATAVVGDSRSDNGEDDDSRVAGSDGGGVVNLIVRAQIDSQATKEGDNKIYVLAQVETENGVVCAIGESLIIEKIWKSNI
ncbi:hypothetical protein PG993_011362 [Apiospora rasikravindrae]|uniref:Thioesterase domain-containing protein n=1 Tax=Apiospora rasikravindrae TaxID=990691 RepID=A0ABR1SDZ6_9PEZI